MSQIPGNGPWSSILPSRTNTEPVRGRWVDFLLYSIYFIVYFFLHLTEIKSSHLSPAPYDIFLFECLTLWTCQHDMLCTAAFEGGDYMRQTEFTSLI